MKKQLFLLLSLGLGVTATSQALHITVGFTTDPDSGITTVDMSNTSKRVNLSQSSRIFNVIKFGAISGPVKNYIGENNAQSINQFANKAHLNNAQSINQFANKAHLVVTAGELLGSEYSFIGQAAFGLGRVLCAGAVYAVINGEACKGGKAKNEKVSFETIYAGQEAFLYAVTAFTTGNGTPFESSE